MGKFKVGDRVRVTRDRASGSTARAGDLGTIHSPEHILMDFPRGVSRREYDGFDWYMADHELEPVEPLKLEVGATVTIGDGKDEWEVTYLGLGTVVQRGMVSFNTDRKNLTVVKAKPEPPKPDYYVNCKGAGPKEHDVFFAGGKVAGVSDGHYQFLGGAVAHSLDNPCKAHSIGKNYYPRTLLVRDNQPYTGNV